MLKKRYENIQFDNNDLREKDYLDNLVYANNLFQKMYEYYNSDKKKPLYIAVTGAWGSGKTTVVNTAIKMLEEKVKVKKFVYDAWKFEGDSFRRTFTKTILDNSDIKKSSKEYKEICNKLYDDKSVETESILGAIDLSKKVDTTYNNMWLLLVLIALVILFWILSIIIPIESLDKILNSLIWVIGIFGGTSIIKSLVSFFSKFMTSRVTYVFQKLFSPEQFYQTVNDILSKVKTDNKLILIDNIDRCNNEELKNTISSIKGFFDEENKIIYIIPFDLEQMNMAYNNEYNSYSEKVFNYNIDLKEKSVKNIIDFINKLVENEVEYQDLFTNSSSDIIALSNCKTPRQILNVCNDYITEYNIFVDKNNLDVSKISSEDLDYLMKYTVLKKYYNEFFRQMHTNIDVIKQIEQFASRRREFIEVSKDFPWLSYDAYQYMRATESITPTNYNYFYSSKSSDDFDIDEEIRQLIDSNEYEKINNIMKESSVQREIILNYMKNRIKYDKYRDSWKPSIISKFKLIIFLMKEKTISLTDYFRYFDFLICDELFDNIIFPLEIQCDEIVYYLNEVSKNKRKYDPISKMIDGIRYEKIKVENERKYEIISFFLSNLNIKKLNDEQKKFINRHFNYLITNHLYANDQHIDLLKSSVVDILDNEKICLLLDSTTANEVKCFELLTDIIQKRCNENIDMNLIGKFVSLVNRLEKNLFDINSYYEIYNLFYTNIDKEEIKNALNSININSIPDNKVSEDTINIIFDIFNKTSILNLKSILLSFNSSENRKFVLQKISLLQGLNSSNMELSKQLIMKLDNEQFDINLNVIILIYGKYDVNYRNWFNTYINSTFPNKIDEFYDLLESREDKELFAEYVISLPLSYDEKLLKIKYFMTSNERFNLLIQNENNLLSLETIKKLCDTHYGKMVDDKIVDVIDEKTNIIGDDVDCVIRMINNNQLNVTVLNRILKSIGLQKTSLDDLKKIFAQLSPTLRGINKQYNNIKSFLIENGLLESTTNKEKVNQI